MMLYFAFTNETQIKIPEAPFRKLLSKAEDLLKEQIEEKMKNKSGIVETIIIDDLKMLVLNSEYRKKNSPTDVISFAYLEIMDKKQAKEDNIIVGDIFISIDTARRQAKERGHSLNKEMQHLFVHGLLHCLGFDHKTDTEEAEMEGWAKKILGK